MLRDLPNIDGACLDVPTIDRLRAAPSTHPPRILLLYGSLRERSYSRFLTQEAERLLNHFGAETRIFNPQGLPLPDGAEVNHPKVQELRELSLWSEGQVWTSPERHGAMSGVMKAQIDWIPLSVGAVRPTQGRTLAVMQVSGGSQSFNAVNQMRVLGRKRTRSRAVGPDAERDLQRRMISAQSRPTSSAQSARSSARRRRWSCHGATPTP